ncbi:MAG: ABC transporter ATP-binding protein [Dehalococcoidia bacterium]|nr:ABC transporter ATP-binding protein [Dehalococcoidia bacterium]
MGGEATAIIEMAGLTKKYGDFTAVDHLDLQIMEGEVFGLLGPNGAGKTTTILMMLGLTEPTAGRVRVAGYDSTRKPLDVKRIVGYLPDNVGFYDDLTARENLRYTASLNGLPSAESRRRIPDLLEKVGLAEAANQKVGSFSRGMRQRLGIADALVKGPKLVVLDEPTLGIDPEGVRHVLELISTMSHSEGITVLISSHLLHQVQQTCDRVGIFVKGRLVAVGPIQTLSQQLMDSDSKVLELQAEPLTTELKDDIRQIKGVDGMQESGGMLLITCQEDVRRQIADRVMKAGAALQHFRMRGFSLEDIYMKYFREA